MSGVNSTRFKLKNERAKGWELDKRKKLVRQLDQLGVKVNQPDEMSIEHLELLVNHHRTTVEARISREQLETAKENGLTKDDVQHRVDDLNWDAQHAVEVKKGERNQGAAQSKKASRVSADD